MRKWSLSDFPNVVATLRSEEDEWLDGSEVMLRLRLRLWLWVVLRLRLLRLLLRLLWFDSSVFSSDNRPEKGEWLSDHFFWWRVRSWMGISLPLPFLSFWMCWIVLTIATASVCGSIAWRLVCLWWWDLRDRDDDDLFFLWVLDDPLRGVSFSFRPILIRRYLWDCLMKLSGEIISFITSEWRVDNRLLTGW